jgi:quinol monooxygenase YgiN
MIVSTLKIVVPARKREEALEVLRMYLGPVCYQAGCISCQCFQELDKENNIIMIEKWLSQAYLDRHLRSKEYKKILTLMDISSELPEIEFHTVWNSAGMELLEKNRG